MKRLPAVRLYLAPLLAWAQGALDGRKFDTQAV